MVNMSERTSNAARFLTHVCRLDTNGVKEPAHSDCGSLVIMEKEGSVCLICYNVVWKTRCFRCCMSYRCYCYRVYAVRIDMYDDKRYRDTRSGGTCIVTRYEIHGSRIQERLPGTPIQEGLLGDKTLSTLSTLEVIFGIFEPTVPSTTVYRTTVAGSVVGLWVVAVVAVL